MIHRQNDTAILSMFIIAEAGLNLF